MNGKRISNLLVNGEDFFRGNPRVALENLPSYMVDKIKVYDLRPDLNKMMDKNINVHKGMWANESQTTVMDVNLKRKYSIGWIANASVGGGTGKHYAAKAFALRFTPHHTVDLHSWDIPIMYMVTHTTMPTATGKIPGATTTRPHTNYPRTCW